MPKERHSMSRRREAKVGHVAQGIQRDRIPPRRANRRAPRVQNNLEIAADLRSENSPSPTPMLKLPAQQLVSAEVQTDSTGNGGHEDNNFMPEHALEKTVDQRPVSLFLGLELDSDEGLFDKTVGKKRKNRIYERNNLGYYEYKADIDTLKWEFRLKTKGCEESKVRNELRDFLDLQASYEVLLVGRIGRKENIKKRPCRNINAVWKVETRDKRANILGNRKNEQPTEKELSRMAKGIGKEYRHLGFELGLEKARIDQICLDYNVTIDKTVAILCEWKNRNDTLATFGELSKALAKVGLGTEKVFQMIM